jgi:hypothetical protein
VRLRIRAQPAVRVLPLHRDRTASSIYVTALEGDPLLRSQAGLGGEDHDRPEGRAEFDGNRIDLVALERAQLLRSRLWIPADFDRRVAGDVTPARGGGEHLPKRRHQPIPR